MMKNKSTGSPHCPDSQLILKEENWISKPGVSQAELLTTLTLVQWEQSFVSYIDVAFLIMLCFRWHLIQQMLHSSNCLLRTLPKLADNNDEQYTLTVLITLHIIIWLKGGLTVSTNANFLQFESGLQYHFLPSLHYCIQKCCTKLPHDQVNGLYCRSEQCNFWF